MNVEFPVEEQIGLMKLRPQHRLADVPRVFQSVHVTDLVAVVCRDGQFRDAQILEHELHDDLRVEMEVVGVFLEGNSRQRLGRIEAIAGVELGELGAEHPVLETGQDLVA